MADGGLDLGQVVFQGAGQLLDRSDEVGIAIGVGIQLFADVGKMLPSGFVGHEFGNRRSDSGKSCYFDPQACQ